MKLVNLNNEYYLLDADMQRAAKDLPEKTLVFCISEIHMNDQRECVRHSTKGDHCYQCQPLVGSTVRIKGSELLLKRPLRKLIPKGTPNSMWNVIVERKDTKIEYKNLILEFRPDHMSLY